jgi:hypothetical protein
MKAFNGLSFAMGIAFCLALVGCMMAVASGNGSEHGRYELQVFNSASGYVVLDSQTGTTVAFNVVDKLGQARPFTPAP